MTKPVYRHPHFVIRTAEKRIQKENKRLWLNITIDKEKDESIVVILKNPSRATKDISDKTVFNVTNYIDKNRIKYKQLNNVGSIIILNLIPFYETYSDLLVTSNVNIIDNENFKTIKKLTKKHAHVIVAWGDCPKGLYSEYEVLKNTIISYLKANNNKVYYVDKLSKSGNPKHGQIWGYDNHLLPFKIQ